MAKKKQDIWTPPTLVEWVTQNAESPKWIIPDLLPAEAKCICTGQKKRGMKSYFSFAMALAIQTGKGPKMLHPTEEYRGRPVLAVQEESTRSETRDRFLQMGRGLGIDILEECKDIYFAFHERLKLDNYDWQKRILSFIQAKNPCLVLLDPFYKLHTADENKGSEVMPILDFLEEIRAKGPTTMLIAHLDKARGENPRADIDTQVRGTGMLTDDYDLHLALRRYSMKEEKIKLITRSKGGADAFYEVCWSFRDKNEGRIKIGEKTPVHSSSVQICPVMGEANEYDLALAKLQPNKGYTNNELGELWGVKGMKLTNMINKALEDDIRIKDGVYFLKI